MAGRTSRPGVPPSTATTPASVCENSATDVSIDMVGALSLEAASLLPERRAGCGGAGGEESVEGG